MRLLSVEEKAILFADGEGLSYPFTISLKAETVRMLCYIGRKKYPNTDPVLRRRAARALLQIKKKLGRDYAVAVAFSEPLERIDR